MPEVRRPNPDFPVKGAKIAYSLPSAALRSRTFLQLAVSFCGLQKAKCKSALGKPNP